MKSITSFVLAFALADYCGTLQTEREKQTENPKLNERTILCLHDKRYI